LEASGRPHGAGKQVNQKRIKKRRKSRKSQQRRTRLSFRDFESVLIHGKVRKIQTTFGSRTTCSQSKRREELKRERRPGFEKGDRVIFPSFLWGEKTPGPTGMRKQGILSGRERKKGVRKKKGEKGVPA